MRRSCSLLGALALLSSDGIGGADDTHDKSIAKRSNMIAAGGRGPARPFDVQKGSVCGI